MRSRVVRNGMCKRAVVPELLLVLFVASAFGQSRPADADGKKEGSSAPSAMDRQKAMQADMDRLLELARRLKNEVDGSRKDELSIKVIRDAEEIDKLARSARGRIR